MPNQATLHDQYVRVKELCAADCKSSQAAHAILTLAQQSLQFLNSESQLVDLVSRVPGKHYVSFQIGNTVARPANVDFFILDETQFVEFWMSWQSATLNIDDLRRFLYTVALSPCLAMELFDRQNKKGPATYFECFIGHLFSSRYDRNPRKRATLPLEGRPIRMTMDFLFEGDEVAPNIHLAVKTSTRERVVQAWSHQRLLDAAFGTHSYRGVMVLFSETKMNSRNLEVVEICVPDQWLAYQRPFYRECKLFITSMFQRDMTSSQIPIPN